MCIRPSSGARKPDSTRSAGHSGAVKAAPWTAQPSSGKEKVCIRSSVKMWTFSLHGVRT